MVVIRWENCCSKRKSGYFVRNLEMLCWNIVVLCFNFAASFSQIFHNTKSAVLPFSKSHFLFILKPHKIIIYNVDVMCLYYLCVVYKVALVPYYLISTTCSCAQLIPLVCVCISRRDYLWVLACLVWFFLSFLLKFFKPVIDKTESIYLVSVKMIVVFINRDIRRGEY